MRPENRRKVIPYLIANLAVLVFFQNCKQNPDTLTVNAPSPESATQPSEGSIGSGRETPTEPEDNNIVSADEVIASEAQPTEVSLLPGEGKKDVILFQPENDSSSNTRKIRLRLSDFNLKRSEVHMHLIRDKSFDSSLRLTCSHLSDNGEDLFDCTDLTEFILENLTRGDHRFKVTMETSDGQTRQAEIAFTIPRRELASTESHKNYR